MLTLYDIRLPGYASTQAFTLLCITTLRKTYSTTLLITGIIQLAFNVMSLNHYGRPPEHSDLSCLGELYSGSSPHSLQSNTVYYCPQRAMSGMGLWGNYSLQSCQANISPCHRIASFFLTHYIITFLLDRLLIHAASKLLLKLQAG